MSEANIIGAFQNEKKSAWLVYILYLCSILVGVTSVIGVIMAYIYRDDSPEWLQSHYTYMIHTFWKGMLYFIVSAVLIVLVIGIPMLIVALIWWIVRCIKGLKALELGLPIPNPRGWGF